MTPAPVEGSLYRWGVCHVLQWLGNGSCRYRSGDNGWVVDLVTDSSNFYVMRPCHLECTPVHAYCAAYRAYTVPSVSTVQQ